ncbi:MAG: transposase [Cyanobacteria bacterium J06626_14]
MQRRFNYKLLPNKTQTTEMDGWLITLRKHRNYSLRERENGYNQNNVDVTDTVTYAFGAHCDMASQTEYGSCCPLTCAVVKHGVIPDSLTVQQLTKTTKEKVDKKTSEVLKPSMVRWDTASGIQMKRTTQLRSESNWYAAIDSDVLQRNISKLDAAYTGFWKHQRGFPAYRKRSNFNSFEYKPNRVKFTVIGALDTKKKRYSRVMLPGIGSLRYHDSRSIPKDADIRTVTVKREADGWYISVLINTKEPLPESIKPEDVKGVLGIDFGINKAMAASDGSFVENRRFATNRSTKRRMKIRQRRVNRKKKGSNNRAKSGKRVARLHKKIADKRNAFQWNAAKRQVDKADIVVIEDLNVKGMKSRCKPKKQKGRYRPNGQSAKRGLNRAISDAAWGEQRRKLEWLAAKQGKLCVALNPAYSSQECSTCGQVSKSNRNGEKFICEQCGYIDHADTQASRTLGKRYGLNFVSNRRKQPTHQSLVPTGGLSESNALCNDSSSYGACERDQAGNPKSKETRSNVSFLKPGYSEHIA